MINLRPLYPAIRLGVTCLVLAIGLRTWLVMGLIEPVTVSGSSMVPALRGAYVTAMCPNCRHEFSVGTEFAAGTEVVPCPQCNERRVPLDARPWKHGDRLWVDRTSFKWRAPERWEVVVARNPEDATELVVKRVVGLPGDLVSLRNGNLLIDGAILPKDYQARQAVRYSVNREQLGSQRWFAESPLHWQLDEAGWQFLDSFGEEIRWLSYQHPDERPLTDNVTYNAGLTRQLNLVNEFLLATTLRVQGTGVLSLSLDDGHATAQVELRFPAGEMTLTESGQRGSPVPLSERCVERFVAGEVELEFSNFDRQLLLVVDGQVELRRSWPESNAQGTSHPVAIGVQGLRAALADLTLYRDIYHSNRAVNAPPPRSKDWLIGPEEYFLLGDNAPVSVDSRLWGPVPARLLIGRLLGN